MRKIEELISYYYGFENVNTIKKGCKYVFQYNDNNYVLSPLIRQKNEIIEIYKFFNDKKRSDKILKNKFNDIITNIYGTDYILTEKYENLGKKIFFDQIMEENGKYDDTSSDFLKDIDHSNWDILWSTKVDYIEYQIKHIENKFPMLVKYVGYYMGMAENAISYFKNIFERYLKYQLKTISHIRIVDENFNDPQNIIIDFPSRDVAEYLKYMFFSNLRTQCSKKNIKSFFDKITLNDIELELVYARMLFPTFFFDSCDMIINTNADEKMILSLVNRADEYEDYIKDIYDVINLQKKIPRITWI